jgi:hypothetical protein
MCPLLAPRFYLLTPTAYCLRYSSARSVSRFKSSLPSLSSVKNLLWKRTCLLVERGHDGFADRVGTKLHFESLAFRRTTHQTNLRSRGVRKIGEPQHPK